MSRMALIRYMNKQKSVKNQRTEYEKGNFQWRRLTEENMQTELVSRVFKN